MWYWVGLHYLFKNKSSGVRCRYITKHKQVNQIVLNLGRIEFQDQMLVRQEELVSHKNLVVQDRQPVTIFWLPFTYAIPEINSVRITSCLCHLSDLAEFKLWNAVYGQSEAIFGDLQRGKSVALTNMPLKSSRSKIEYLVCIWVSFLKKNPIGIVRARKLR